MPAQATAEGVWARRAALERDTGVRHEVYDGEVFAMTGGTPRLIVEVLSPSTAGWDLGRKFLRYRRIDSLAQVVFVDPEEPRVESYTLRDGRWVLEDVPRDGQVDLTGLSVQLQVARLFRNLPPPPERDAEPAP